jgi:REP element-mobilizing transposase RayT
VTICAQARGDLFGHVAAHEIVLSEPGLMVQHWWLALPEQFPGVTIGSWVLMPDHLHGIIECGRTGDERAGRPPALGRMVRWFKAATTNAYIRSVRRSGWPPFNRRLWQRNYFEHVVRDGDERARIAAYIADNPSRWRRDPG